MQLVVFGLTISSSWGNGHATLWRGLLRAIAHRGHQVTFFERDVPYYAQNRDLVGWTDGELVLYPDWSSVEERARAAVRAANVSIVSSFCPDSQAASQLVQDNAGLKIFYDLDTPVTLNQYSKQGFVSYLPTEGLSGFDLVLSYTGGLALAELVRLFDARKAVTLYGHADPNFHYPSCPETGHQASLSYLGTYANDRQPVLEEMFFETARRLPQRRFMLAGALYPETFDWPQNVDFVRHLPPSEHPAFFSSSAMTLNVTRPSMAAMGFCPSGRLFEAASCQTPIVSDLWVGIEEFFEPGKEILLAQTTQEVVDSLSIDAAQLAEIGLAARRRVLSQHTSDHRAQELEDILSNL
ncbi:MAG: glycosyltransferase [Verrucomicrobia bacterium]|nr:glycosyltransferase [Verrucomicrobiota bacterium]MBV8485765.1 glycosyltransferase [Verrucomicrobiota bacterium]